jgi:hypothetical protein
MRSQLPRVIPRMTVEHSEWLHPWLLFTECRGLQDDTGGSCLTRTTRVMPFCAQKTHWPRVLSQFVCACLSLSLLVGTLPHKLKSCRTSKVWRFCAEIGVCYPFCRLYIPLASYDSHVLSVCYILNQAVVLINSEVEDVWKMGSTKGVKKGLWEDETFGHNNIGTPQKLRGEMWDDRKASWNKRNKVEMCWSLKRRLKLVRKCRNRLLI